MRTHRSLIPCWITCVFAAGLGCLATTAMAAPVAERDAALIDGRVIDHHPVTAVGALLAVADDGTAVEGAFMCSAVLVGPTVALTAAHCVALVEVDAAEEGWQLDWWLSFAPDVSDFDGPDPILPGDSIAVRPVVHRGFDPQRPIRSDRPDAAHDIAVLLLDRAAPVAPVPLVSTAMGDDAMGDAMGDGVSDAILMAGYGMRSDEPDSPDARPGQRRAGPGRIFAVGDHELRVGRRLDPAAEVDDALAEKCAGDSGGPTFVLTVDGWRVIGLTSRAHAADPGCALAGLDTRVDVYADWVERVAAASPDGGGCAVAPSTPRCPWIALLLPALVWSGRRRRRQVPL